MIEFIYGPAEPGKPIPHYWELCVNSRHVVMDLSADWRKQHEKCHN